METPSAQKPIPFGSTLLTLSFVIIVGVTAANWTTLGDPVLFLVCVVMPVGYLLRVGGRTLGTLHPQVAACRDRLRAVFTRLPPHGAPDKKTFSKHAAKTRAAILSARSVLRQIDNVTVHEMLDPYLWQTECELHNALEAFGREDGFTLLLELARLRGYAEAFVSFRESFYVLNHLSTAAAQAEMEDEKQSPPRGTVPWMIAHLQEHFSLPHQFTKDDVTKAFRRAVNKYHTDHHHGLRPEISRQYAELCKDMVTAHDKFMRMEG